MEFHDLANIMPMMVGDEFMNLVADIEKNGQLEPIVLFEGKILDGRNRYEACEVLSITPEYTEYTGDDPLGFVLTTNVFRRHLNESQRACIANELAPLDRGRPDKCANWRIYSQEEAAGLLNTSRRSVQRARFVEDADFNLYNNVKMGLMAISKALRIIKERERAETPELPSDKYRIIYADCPWSYGNAGIIGDDNYGHVGRHYPSMTIEELCALPVKDLAEDNAVLFMWVTSPLLEECFDVIKAWGFKYKTSFVWDKVGHNFGHYNSVRHEFLLVCTRGSCTPDNNKLYDSVQSIEKSDVHSEKPEEFRDIIDDLYTHGKRIELFSRTTAEGWEVWGNEPTINTVEGS